MLLLLALLWAVGRLFQALLWAIRRIFRAPWSVVPAYVERAATAEVNADDDVDLVDHEGKLTQRVGASLRIAKEVKLRFGGTPKLTEANRLVAARFIDEALIEHGVTRKLDRARMMYRVRALVFTRLAEEREENQWLNSRTLQDQHDAGSGWVSLVDVEGWRAWVPWPMSLILYYLGRDTRSRVESSA